jgi:hypothetical protein
MHTGRNLCRATLAACCSILAAACRPASEDQSSNNVATNVAEPAIRVTVADPPLNRAALIDAVAQARSASALGRDDLEAQRRLDGKPFEVRIRFGCRSPVEPMAESASFKVRFDEAERTLRISASPDLSLGDALAAQIAGDAVEAVEGFWMRQPWLLTDGCPADPPERSGETPGWAETASPGAERRTDEKREPDETAGAAVLPTAPSNWIGLAQFFTDADPRTGRRDHRAYEVTKVLGESEGPSREGYNLVLSGRLRQLPGGRVIHCRVEERNAPPECIVSAQFDRVWIERPGSGEVLAEWTS